MITLSPEHAAARATAALAATLVRLNAGLTGAHIDLYATAQPANGADAGGLALATFVLPKPAGSIEDGVLTLDPVDDAMIAGTGIALWARWTVDGTHELDCDVSDMEGTGTLKLSLTQLYAGGTARLSSGTLS
jgi:hypothetical protein